MGEKGNKIEVPKKIHVFLYMGSECMSKLL